MKLALKYVEYLFYIQGNLVPRTQQEIRDIQEVVANKEIPYLVHFTRLENLTSILTNGLYPRAEIDKSKTDMDHPLFWGNAKITNDQIRVDYKPAYNCASISFPNCRMFYKYRQQQNSSWAVLILHPKILWEKDCLFYSTNAASSTVSSFPKEQFSTVRALENMFDGRRDTWLQPHDPTDVQAEIMIYGIIEPTYIHCCLFENSEVIDKYSQAFPNVKMIQHDRFYSTRQYARESGFKK